jgi:hypothetical protein
VPLPLALLPAPSVIPATASIPRSRFSLALFRAIVARVFATSIRPILLEPAVIRVLLERDPERHVADERAPLDPVVV